MAARDMDPHSQVETALNEGRPIEAQYVRQGKRNYRIVWVLAIALLLAALATFGAWMMRAGDLASTNDATGQEQVDAQAFSDTGASPGTQESGMTGSARAPASAQPGLPEHVAGAETPAAANPPSNGR